MAEKLFFKSNHCFYFWITSEAEGKKSQRVCTQSGGIIYANEMEIWFILGVFMSIKQMILFNLYLCGGVSSQVLYFAFLNA